MKWPPGWPSWKSIRFAYLWKGFVSRLQTTIIFKLSCESSFAERSAIVVKITLLKNNFKNGNTVSQKVFHTNKLNCDGWWLSVLSRQLWRFNMSKTFCRMTKNDKQIIYQIRGQHFNLYEQWQCYDIEYFMSESVKNAAKFVLIS